MRHYPTVCPGQAMSRISNLIFILILTSTKDILNLWQPNSGGDMSSGFAYSPPYFQPYTHTDIVKFAISTALFSTFYSFSTGTLGQAYSQGTGRFSCWARWPTTRSEGWRGRQCPGCRVGHSACPGSCQSVSWRWVGRLQRRPGPPEGPTDRLGFPVLLAASSSAVDWQTGRYESGNLALNFVAVSWPVNAT